MKVEAILEHHATGLPVPGHLGNAINRPMTSKRHRTDEIQEKMPQSSPGSQTYTKYLASLINDGDSHFFPLVRVSHFLAPRESSNSIIVTKTSQSSGYTVASSVDSAKRCTAVHNALSIFVDTNLTEMRQPSLELFCSVVGNIFHMFFFLRANSMFASIKSGQLPSCSKKRAFGLLPLCPSSCRINR